MRIATHSFIRVIRDQKCTVVNLRNASIVSCKSARVVWGDTTTRRNTVRSFRVVMETVWDMQRKGELHGDVLLDRDHPRLTYPGDRPVRCQ